MATGRRQHYFKSMNTLSLIAVLLLLFGGGGFFLSGPVIGGSELGVILLLCLAIFRTGGFSTRKI